MIWAVLAAAMAGPAAEVAGLDWMAGAWVQEKAGGAVREMWLAPRDSAMAGVTLTTRPGRPPVAEYAKITVEPAGVTFTALVGGQPPTPFVLLPGEAGEAVFENKTHDFPQRVFYRRCGEDLCAGIEGTVDGKPQRQEWRYRRAAP
ncbi:MAG: DUF6265 family protein [Phenylobacterium sp.]